MIADNVGDNVGDCAGMGADVYESFVVTAIAAIILAALIGVPGNLAALTGSNQLLELPLLLGAAGIVGSILGGLYIRNSIKKDPMGALNIALMITAAITIIIDVVFINSLLGSSRLGYYLLGSAIVGVVVVIVIERVADYFTSYRYPPVRNDRRGEPDECSHEFLGRVHRRFAKHRTFCGGACCRHPGFVLPGIRRFRRQCLDGRLQHCYCDNVHALADGCRNVDRRFRADH